MPSEGRRGTVSLAKQQQRGEMPRGEFVAVVRGPGNEVARTRENPCTWGIASAMNGG